MAGGEIVQVSGASRRHRLRGGYVGIVVLALALGGACSDDDDGDDVAPAAGGSTAPAVMAGNAGSAPNSPDPQCVDDIAVVEMDDDTVVVEPEATFERTWVIENTGRCTWSSEYAWSFTGGDALTIESVTPVGSVAPGQTAEITVTLHAPAEVGRYAGQFQLVAPGTMEPLGQAMPYTVEVAR